MVDLFFVLLNSSINDLIFTTKDTLSFAITLHKWLKSFLIYRAKGCHTEILKYLLWHIGWKLCTWRPLSIEAHRLWDCLSIRWEESELYLDFRIDSDWKTKRVGLHWFHASYISWNDFKAKNYKNRQILLLSYRYLVIGYIFHNLGSLWYI